MFYGVPFAISTFLTLSALQTKGLVPKILTLRDADGIGRTDKFGYLGIDVRNQTRKLGKKERGRSVHK